MYYYKSFNISTDYGIYITPYFSDVYRSLDSYRYIPRVGSPLSIDDPVQRVRQQNYIARWNDMFSQDRLDAMDTLRRYSDDYENNQRIVFLAIQVCRVALKGVKPRRPKSALYITGIWSSIFKWIIVLYAII